MGNGSVVPAVVLDADVAFFDIDVGSAAFSHCAELHQVALGAKLPIANSTFSVPITLFTWVNTARLRSIIE